MIPDPILHPSNTSIPGVTAPMINEPTPRSGFPTTHWSRVARAVDPGGPEARAALADLCAAYWYPIYTLVRRWATARPTPST